MSEPTKQTDSYRFLTESDQRRISDASDKLVKEAEYKVVTKATRLFGNVKLAQESEPSLTKVEGNTSTAVVFDGKVKVHAFINNKKVAVEVPIMQNVMEEVQDVDLQNLVNEAEESKTDLAIMDAVMASPLVADLDKFEVTADQNSDWLKITHPALDMGKELGVVSKEEYNGIKDKEAFFKSTLENVILKSNLENHYELQFSGAFVEPQVKTAEVITEPVIEKKAEQTFEVEHSEMPSKEESLQAKQADSFRQLTETEELRVSQAKDRLANKIVNDLRTHLSNLKYDSVKIGSSDASKLGYTDNFTGFIDVTATLQDSSGLKVVSIPVSVVAGEYKLPKKEVVADLVSKAPDILSKVHEQIAQETIAKMAEIDAVEEYKAKEVEAALEDPKPEITKTASEQGSASQYVGPMDVMQVNKHILGLPDDTELGTTIYANGEYWQLTNKSKDQLSKGANDASTWTFSKVSLKPIEPTTKPEAAIGN